MELEESEKTTREDYATVELGQATQGRLSRMDAMQVRGRGFAANAHAH